MNLKNKIGVLVIGVVGFLIINVVFETIGMAFPASPLARTATILLNKI